MSSKFGFVAFYKIIGFTKCVPEDRKWVWSDLKDGIGKLLNRIAANAVEDLQSASKDFLIHLFIDSIRAIEHVKRTTLIRGYKVTVLKD